jgi:hypothetical protein
MLKERQILLSLQKKDLKMREAKLAEEQACGLHPCDRWDLPVELEELHEHMTEVEEEHVAKTERLAALVVEASKALVYLGLPPILEVPQIPRKAQEVLKAAGIILERL